MHIVLTDILTCPVCGPDHGLIVRTDTLQDRRIIEGAFGCPNCRHSFPVSQGIADLDPTPEGSEAGDAVVGQATDDPSAALRMAALLGLDDTSGFVLIAGPDASHAPAISEYADRVELIADARHAGGGAISRMLMGARLPFYNARLRGIWLSGASADLLLEEAARALHPIGRLVLDPAPEDASTRLAAAGLLIKAEQDGAILATKV